MSAWVLAALLRIAPALVVDQVHLAELHAAISETVLTREEAALLVSLLWWETGGSLDCSRVGDHGLAWGCWQVHVPVHERLRTVSDMRFAARTALRFVRSSLRRCGDLREYTSGSCAANRAAKVRWNTAQWLLNSIGGDA